MMKKYRQSKNIEDKRNASASKDDREAREDLRGMTGIDMPSQRSIELVKAARRKGSYDGAEAVQAANEDYERIIEEGNDDSRARRIMGDEYVNKVQKSMQDSAKRRNPKLKFLEPSPYFPKSTMIKPQPRPKTPKKNTKKTSKKK